MEKSKGFIRLLVRTWTGAGFSIAFFALFMLHLARYDLYDWSQSFFHFRLAAIFYGYGLICSLLLHLLAARFPRLAGVPLLVLHGVLGFAFFLFRGVDAHVLIFGFFGAVFAFLFYAGVWYAGKSRPFTFLFAVLVPFLFLLVQQADFTVKRGWQERAEHSRFVATFDWFDWEHAIPLQLEKGEELEVRIRFDPENEGGYGYRVRTGRNGVVPMQPLGDGHFRILPEADGEYRVIVRGSELKGSVTVEWEKRDNP